MASCLIDQRMCRRNRDRRFRHLNIVACCLHADPAPGCALDFRVASLAGDARRRSSLSPPRLCPTANRRKHRRASAGVQSEPFDILTRIIHYPCGVTLTPFDCQRPFETKALRSRSDRVCSIISHYVSLRVTIRSGVASGRDHGIGQAVSLDFYPADFVDNAIVCILAPRCRQRYL